MSIQERRSALVQALIAILLAATSSNGVFVVGCREKTTSQMTYEDLLRTAVYQKMHLEKDVRRVLESRISQYMEDKGWGIILFLFSVLLSKGIHKVGVRN